MVENKTATGSQLAAILNSVNQTSITDADYSTTINPYAGPYYLARLLTNLPVDAQQITGLGLPWQTIALSCHEQFTPRSNL